jgi:hypothetical protein
MKRGKGHPSRGPIPGSNLGERMMLAHNARHGWHRDAWTYREPRTPWLEMMPGVFTGMLGAYLYGRTAKLAREMGK